MKSKEKSDNELRLYSFQNMYLPGVHCGPQGTHSAMEMVDKYSPIVNSSQSNYLYSWSRYHKTIIVVNGGHHSHLLELSEFLDCEENPYPWASFRESEEALNCAMTNVCIVLPERVYNYENNKPYSHAITEIILNDSEDILRTYCQSFTEFEVELYERISKCKLMT